MKYRTADIIPPPVAKLTEAAKRFIGSTDFLDLGQGLPGHVPPDAAVASLRERLSHPSIHVYTPEQGLLELREELSLYLRRTSGIDINPQNELVITAGATNAFTNSLQLMIGPSENILMASPIYYKYVAAVKLLGGSVKEIPTDKNFQLIPEHFEEAIDASTRAIFLHSPNNPTGAVYHKKTIDQIVDICLQHELILISDETYSRMTYEGSNHYSPRLRRDAENHVITIGSFSNDFGMSGWRVGYVCGPEQFIEEFLKVQSASTLCASTAGQLLALDVLKNGLDTIDGEIERLDLLRDLAYLRIDEIDEFDAIRTKGTFYIFPRVKNYQDSGVLALDILQNTNMLVLPGRFFGKFGEGHLRLSIGPLTPEAVDEAFDRLEKYFEN